MTPLGAGIDIIAIRRIQAVLSNPGSESFLRKVYTSDESRRADERSDRVEFLARIFAAKEAVFKTFGIPGSREVRFRDIEIRAGEFDEPLVSLSGYFAELARERGIEKVLLSVSYDGDYAIAMAVLQARNVVCADCSAAMPEKMDEQQNKVFPSCEAIA